MNAQEDPPAVRGRRRSKAWARVSYGLYRTQECSVLHAWQLVLPPTGRFTHLTAAALMGWWLPPLPAGLPMLAAVDRSSTRPTRAGLHVVRTDPIITTREMDGLRLDAPGEVVLACARDLGLLDLVMLVDGALHLGACTRAELTAAAAPRRKGGPAVRRALELADRRSESPWESVLRLHHVVCEVPVEPQRELWTSEGDFVARADLWIEGTRTIHEYDGGVHLSREQQRADLARARRLSDAGYVRRGYTAHDLLRQPVCILREADRALGRPHDPSRLREWHALLTASLLTESGQRRLMRRLASSRA
jgi:very-short-patch-repair endonuclease